MNTGYQIPFRSVDAHGFDALDDESGQGHLILSDGSSLLMKSDDLEPKLLQRLARPVRNLRKVPILLGVYRGRIQAVTDSVHFDGCEEGMPLRTCSVPVHESRVETEERVFVLEDGSCFTVPFDRIDQRVTDVLKEQEEPVSLWFGFDPENHQIQGVSVVRESLATI